MPGLLVVAPVFGAEPTTLSEVTVIGVTPVHGVGLPKDQLPYPVQDADGQQIRDSLSGSLADFMNQRLGSVSINEAQNNPLQPDVQYRGFTASPLLGLPQGIAIYQNGARINDAFGDAVNWDLMSQSAIGSVNLMGGSNPVFGLNALGGALSIQMKNGFTHPGYSAQLMGGSFDRVQGYAEGGWNNGTLGAYVNVDFMTENGWREESPTDAVNLFGSFGWHVAGSAVDLDLAYANTDLTGNGAIPVQLMQLDRSAVFTFPDTTKNELFSVNLNAEHWFNKQVQVSGNLFYRNLDTKSFNGDAGDFAECPEDDEAGLLCDPEGVVLEDRAGDPIAAEDANGNPYDAINNRSSRKQETGGGTVQATFLQRLFGLGNQFILGAGYFTGDVTFNADVEIARLLANRSTAGSGILEADGVTRLDATTRSSSVYFSDSLNLTEALTLTLAGRYNDTEIENSDQSGERPDLNGTSTYSRFNPAAGLTFQAAPGVNLYGGYSESSRAPTPVELACADPQNECRLPNAFLADPPLDQVVARTFELGVRGDLALAYPVNYQLGLFQTINQDDILFQAGGASGNLGFFDNIGDTRRQGLELTLGGTVKRVAWFLNYTYLQATFQNDFYSHSPNHPVANAEGNIYVESGDRLPGIPLNNLKTGLDWQITPRFSAGLTVIYQSGQYYRGDESNKLPKIAGYAVVNLRGEYRVTNRFAILAKVSNLFDTEYSSFGVLGQADQVLGDAYLDPRFDGPGAPFGGWVGVRLSL
ncbi:TonB-dependent receptor [uncultured Thiodictyon sp.]|jgi:outer membrane receptor protein involved in Fe transport|uniref:TonB-dependent receptor n=1 Tax=uncultured Thiodictyon sp. TaxID=1846217 RepID=UPI0025F144CA|nr:TonB-dependent receptor [uncultured Thiodictyon sp.]